MKQPMVNFLAKFKAASNKIDQKTKTGQMFQKHAICDIFPYPTKNQNRYYSVKIITKASNGNFKIHSRENVLKKTYNEI